MADAARLLPLWPAAGFRVLAIAWSLLGYFGLLSAGLMLIVGGLLFGFRWTIERIGVPFYLYKAIER